MSFLPKDRIEQLVKNQAGEVNVIKVKNIWGTVSTIELDTVRSYMANPMGLESSQWDWIHVDEPIPEGMWNTSPSLKTPLVSSLEDNSKMDGGSLTIN